MSQMLFLPKINSITVMKNLLLFSTVLLLSLSGCIKDDIVFDSVDPVLRITNVPDSIGFGTSFQFDFRYLNNVGQEEEVNPEWSSSDPEIISIDATGLAEGLQTGEVLISVSYTFEGSLINDSALVAVGTETVISEEPSTDREGNIRTTSSYALTGEFTLIQDEEDLILEFAADYVASSALPGLYVYLTNNPNTTNGALEIAKVTTFNGAHSYRIPNTDINDFNHVLYFCKPFNVKVGDGEIQ